MIQRSQSVYLLLACLLMATASWTLYAMPEVALAGYRLVFLAAEVVIGLASLVAIFLFKQRDLQATVVAGIRLMSLLLIVALLTVLYISDGLAVLVAGGFIGVVGVLIGPLVSLVAVHFAGLAVRRDIDLIRSMDRLR